MGKFLWHVTMSLDGLDWVFGYAPLDSGESRRMIEETVRANGSVLSGRRSYNVGRKPGRHPEAQVIGGTSRRPAIRADAPCAQGRNGSDDPVSDGRHPQRRERSALGRPRQRSDGDCCGHRAAVHSGRAGRRDSRTPGSARARARC
jgi:hypothetical protein